MNIKRLILAIVAAFVVLWVTDFLIHGIWMMPDYRATQSLWRPEAEMGSYMAWMLCAQLLFVITFVLVWAKGFRQLRNQNRLRHRLRRVDGTVLRSLGHHNVRCRTDALFNRHEMVLRRYRANNSARARHILDLQAVGTRDRDITRAG
jgi:hypothetical protein